MFTLKVTICEPEITVKRIRFEEQSARSLLAERNVRPTLEEHGVGQGQADQGTEVLRVRAKDLLRTAYAGDPAELGG